MRASAAVLVALLGLAHGAAAQVDCSDPNNLCTGDPCVIASVEVEEPCVVDFGPRAVHIGGLRRVRNVDFTAASFLVQGAINGGVGSGGHFSLTATTGGIVVDGPINLTGGASPAGPGDAAVRLVAAQDIALDQPMRFVASPVGFGGASELELDAGGDLLINASISSLEGVGAFTLRAGGLVQVLGAIRSAQVSFSGSFADLAIEAGGDVVIGGPIYIVDGEISVDAGGGIVTHKSVRTRGPSITLLAESDVITNAVVTAIGRAGNTLGCGGVSLLSNAGGISVNKSVSCTGRFGSAGIVIAANGPVLVDGKLKSRVDVDPGGPISITSATSTVTVAGKLDTHGTFAGDVLMSGSAVQADLSRADTRPGGRQTYTATAGNLVLEGSFLAQDSGTIEGSASGNLTAIGNFRVGPSGCISLTAGGTVDTSAANPDQPLSGSCP